jgi:hypothetical protein
MYEVRCVHGSVWQTLQSPAGDGISFAALMGEHFSQMNVSAYQTSQCHNQENVLRRIFAINVLQTSGKDF